MKNILTTLSFQYICNAADIIREGKNNDLSKLNTYSNKKGIFVLTESDEIIYVGRGVDLKKRISQCLREKSDTGSINAAEDLNDEYYRICHANIYVLEVKDDDFKKSICSYSIFRKDKK